MKRLEMRKVKFGIFTDLHVDIMHDGEERLLNFLNACRKENVDFIIELGDFCYPDENRKCICAPDKMPVNVELALKNETYVNKDKIISMYRDFEKPSYHVLGNHDCDMCSKKQVLEYYGDIKDEYYSFNMGGFHFVVLDGNYMRINGKDVSFENGNYFDESYRPDKVLPYISDEQLKWLKKDLETAQYPSVLFSHQRLTKGHFSILNHEDLRKIIVNAPNKVVLAVNGHEHIESVEKKDGIWFYTLNSMSNFWLDEKFACENRYGKEIDEKYPNIKFVAPYDNAIFAIITLDENGATVKGASGNFVGPTPEELGVYKSGSPLEFLKDTPTTPCITDSFMEF